MKTNSTRSGDWLASNSMSSRLARPENQHRTVQDLMKEDAAAYAIRQRNSGRIKKAAWLTLAGLATAGVGSAFVGGGAAVAPVAGKVVGGTTMAGMAPAAGGSIVGPMAGYGPITSAAGWSAPAAVAPIAAAGKGASMSSLARYGVPAATSLATNYMAGRASNKANTAALASSDRQFELTQQFLRDEAKAAQDRHDAVEGEKKRQFDAVEGEKRRRYDDSAPWRDYGRQSITRMNSLMLNGPQQATYRPTFGYRS